MENEKTHYQILGVTPDAGDIVRAAHKALSQRYHPDKFKGSAKFYKLNNVLLLVLFCFPMSVFSEVYIYV